MTFLENVASAPEEVKDLYDSIMRVKPMLIDAAIFGWVQRKCLYWAAGPKDEDLSHNGKHLPEGLTTRWAKGRTTLSYQGTPIPKAVRLEAGYRWSGKRPEKVVEDGGGGAMYPSPGSSVILNNPPRPIPTP